MKRNMLLNEMELLEIRFPEKVISFFYPQKTTSILSINSKIFSIQPIIIIIFILGLISPSLIRLNMIPEKYAMYGFLATLLPIIYFLYWFLWQISIYPAYVGKNGIMLETRAVNKFGSPTVHFFTPYSYEIIKYFYITNKGLRLFINKYNILNTTFYIDLFVEKNSVQYSTILKYLKDNKIVLKK